MTRCRDCIGVVRGLARREVSGAPGERATADHLWRFIVAELEACSLGDYAQVLRQELMERGGLLFSVWSYSRLVGDLRKADIELNRKVLADLAMHDPVAFEQVVKQASP